MAKLNHSIPHNLTKEEALSRIKGLLQKVKTEQADTISNLQEEWTEDEGRFSFTAKGFDIAGILSVSDSSVDLNADVPFAVSLFSGAIKGMITKEARELLDK